MHLGFWWGNLRERDQSEDLGIGGRIVLKWIFKALVWGDMDRIYVAQDKDMWAGSMCLKIRTCGQAHVSTVISHQVP
jgi:hypothetical protein